MTTHLNLVSNMNKALSKYQNIKFLTGGMTRETVLDQLSTEGYCIFRGTNLHRDIFSDDDDVMLSATEHIQSCLFGEDFSGKIMNYAMGTDARDKQRNQALLSVSKISSGHWVPYHNELLYTNEFPRVISFICVKAPAIGGQTPLTNTIETYYQMPKMMRNKFDKYGIRYVRNLRDKMMEQSITNNPLDLGGQKFVQDIFGTNNRDELLNLCEIHGYECEWHLCQTNYTPIMRIQYVVPAVVEYSFGGNKILRSFANSVTGMNGRYFTNYNAYYDLVPYMERPFHSLWGNGDEFTDEEYAMIEELFTANSIRFDWEDGDIIVADNLAWAHGRYPFEGERNILAIMGEPYARYPYMIHQKEKQTVVEVGM